MYLECVIVCVNYDDYLSVTLPLNKQHFDNIVVVTAPTDSKTQEICNINGVKSVITDRFYENGAKFNKGKAINVGFNSLHKKDWVLHLDADMVLPDNFRKSLEPLNLQKEVLYGISRLMCPTPTSWAEFLKTGEQKPKWAHQRRAMNIGVGFFQLFHATNTKLSKPWYPEEFGHAGRSDRFFARKIGKITQLRGIIGIHLDNESNNTPVMGANWNGRVSPRFEIRLSDH